MILVQFIVWGMFSIKGGNLTDKLFFIFTFGMLIGQTGAGIDSYLKHAWGALAVQIYFFVFTAIAGVQRFVSRRGK